MTPEEQAREQIDNRLVQSGWIVLYWCLTPLRKYYEVKRIVMGSGTVFVLVNGKVNQDMYNAVSEANDKLQKYMSLEEWGECM